MRQYSDPAVERAMNVQEVIPQAAGAQTSGWQATEIAGA